MKHNKICIFTVLASVLITGDSTFWDMMLSHPDVRIHLPIHPAPYAISLILQLHYCNNLKTRMVVLHHPHNLHPHFLVFICPLPHWRLNQYQTWVHT